MHHSYPLNIYEQLFLRAPIGMALVSLDGEYLKTNQALCDLLGYTETELLVRHFKDVTLPEDSTAGDEQRTQLTAGLIDGFAYEKRYVKKDGTIIWVKVNNSLMTLPDKTKYFIGHVQNINDAKLASIEGNAHTMELTKMNSLMVEREIKMVALKKDNRELTEQVAALQTL